MALIPEWQRQRKRKVDLCEFEVSMVYIVSSSVKHHVCSVLYGSVRELGTRLEI